MTDPPPVHVVTGASAGMGASCVKALTARGDVVVAVARRADVLDRLWGDDEKVRVVAADVGNAADRSAVIETAAATAKAVGAGPIASLIHGAATAVELQPWTTLDPDELTAHFNVHVAAAIALTGALHDGIGVERCVIFDSYSASTPRHGWAAYSILKAAAQMAFRTAAEELDDLAVIRAYPGAVATPLVARVLDAPRSIKATEAFHELNDSGRVSTPDEIAEQLVPILDRSVDELRAQDTWMIGHPA